MILTDEIKETIENLGYLSYNPEKCAIILDITEKEFNENQEIQKIYLKGQTIADFRINIKLFELATQGDLNALKEFDRRRKGKTLG